jgi:hypothetical protein
VSETSNDTDNSTHHFLAHLRLRLASLLTTDLPLFLFPCTHLLYAPPVRASCTRLLPHLVLLASFIPPLSRHP